jgi:SHS family lactate transporter-like MFS transporter
MTSNNPDTTKQEVEQVESIHQTENISYNDDLSFKNYTEKEEQKQNKKSIFIRFKDSIYQKPEKTQNVWHLLTNLDYTQRITFVAGKM